MKKIHNIFLFLAVLLMFAVACEKDDFPGPDAQVFGAIKDSLDGVMVEQDIQTGSQIEVQELGFATPVSQFWVIKPDGEYRNNLVFSNDYDIYMRNGNFFPYTLKNVKIGSGENKIDFNVVPYIRVKNVNITRNTGTNKIEASFTLEAGKPNVKLAQIGLYAFSDMYVGEIINKVKTVQTFSAATIDPAVTYTLTIDAANSYFVAGRDYFFRVGAKASLAGVGTIRSNYAPYVKITF